LGGMAKAHLEGSKDSKNLQGNIPGRRFFESFEVTKGMASCNPIFKGGYPDTIREAPRPRKNRLGTNPANFGLNLLLRGVPHASMLEGQRTCLEVRRSRLNRISEDQAIVARTVKQIA